MPRTTGSQNIKSFSQRDTIDTRAGADVMHLAKTYENPLEELRAQVKNQNNFVKWIDSRHERIQELYVAAFPQRTKPGAKDSTYRKYQWFAEQLVLLECINAFEVFYKRTISGLASVIREYVPPDGFNISIDARRLWHASDSTSLADIIFEHQLFHDLEAIDKSLNALIGARRYNKNNPAQNMTDRVKAIQAVFQIRHTLSHNSGLVTNNDSYKFFALGYSVSQNEVIDPVMGQMRESVNREILAEAKDFYSWLIKKTVKFLNDVSTSTNQAIPNVKRAELEKLLGVTSQWDNVNWAN